MHSTLTLQYIHELQLMYKVYKTVKRGYVPSGVLSYNNCLLLLETWLKHPQGFKISYFINRKDENKYRSLYNTYRMIENMGLLYRLPGLKGFVFSDKGKAFIRDIELELVRLRGLK